MASLNTLCSDPEGDSAANQMARWYNTYADPLTPDAWLWFGTGGPKLSGMPTPSGMACEIAPGAQYRPGCKVNNIKDAWKIFNALTSVNTPQLVASTEPTGWKTSVPARTYYRSYNQRIWKKWYSDGQGGVSRPYKHMDLADIRDWPYLPPDREGDLLATYDDGALSYFALSPWYIEKGTGAVYLDLNFSVVGRYVQSLGKVYQTLLISSEMGRKQFQRGGTQPASVREINWTANIVGVTADMKATYWCWAPLSQPVVAITVVENWFKSISFS